VSQVVLGVAGGIAAYKAVELLRQLTESGHDVRVVPTASALAFVGAPTWAALSGKPVTASTWDDVHDVPHVRIAQQADLIIVAPATANLLAKAAHGLADDLLTNTLLTARCPVVMAPAMHTEMWEHAGVQRNVAQVLVDGAVLVGPDSGDLASGDTGVGRLADPAEIVEAIVFALSEKDLTGARVLVTVGPTREALDPVRYISNRSTGRMGFAVALEAHRRGAQVTVVSGPTLAAEPNGVAVVRVETAEEMYDECLGRFEETDVAILSAAVADWRPAEVASEKVKKANADRTIALEPTQDIAAELGRKKGPQLLVLFAAETESVVDNAKLKLDSKHADLVVANRVGVAGTGFDSETNDAALVSAVGVDQLERMSKDELAARIIDRVVELRGR